MADFGATALHFGLFIYGFTMDVGVPLALALTFNGYDIKQNRRRIFIIAIVLGTVAVACYYLPQLLRISLLLLVAFITIKLFFSFTTDKAIVVFFTFYFIEFVNTIPSDFILAYCFGISNTSYFASPLLRLVYPLTRNIPLAILTYISYRKRWHILKNIRRVKIAWILPPTIQSTLLCIASNELFFASRLQSTIHSILVISALISMFFLWCILQFAKREAAITAQEEWAQHMLYQTDAIREQRHDFNNHLQIIMGLVRDRQKQEVCRYLKTLKQDLT
jgi:hypothetical protein